LFDSPCIYFMWACWFKLVGTLFINNYYRRLWQSLMKKCYMCKHFGSGSPGNVYAVIEHFAGILNRYVLWLNLRPLRFSVSTRIWSCHLGPTEWTVYVLYIYDPNSHTSVSIRVLRSVIKLSFDLVISTLRAVYVLYIYHPLLPVNDPMISA